MWSMVLETYCAVVQAVMNALVWSAVAGPSLGAWGLSILTSAFFAPSPYGLTPTSAPVLVKRALPSGQGPSLVQALACLLTPTGPYGHCFAGWLLPALRSWPLWGWLMEHKS